MKIIVDEMPKTEDDCLFSSYDGDGYFICSLKGNCVGVEKCSCIKPITEFHAVERLGKDIGRVIPIE